MQQTKFIAKILYYISLVLAIGYLGSVIYSIFCIVTGLSTQTYSDGQFLRILFPFTQQPFMIVDNNATYIIVAFALPLSLYGIFFWMAARVFKVFLQPKLFTRENIVELKRFYVLNIFVPLPISILASFFIPVENIIWGLGLVHFFLGIFAFFLAGIFAQGVSLQKEQDLFI